MRMAALTPACHRISEAMISSVHEKPLHIAQATAGTVRVAVSTGRNFPSTIDSARMQALDATGAVSASYARALLRAVAEHGHDPVGFAEAEGVTVEQLEAGSLVSAALFGRLYQRAMLLLQDESLGMVSGGPVARGTFRMMCLCVIHRPTLGSIVARAGEFLDVCRGVAVKPQVQESAADTGIGFALARGETKRSLREILDAEGPLRVRTSFYLWHSLLSWFAGRPLPLRQVEFDFAMPPNGDQWTRFFRCPVRFDCTESLLRMDRDLLDLPNVQSEQSLAVFLKSAPYRLIVPSYHDQKTSDRVVALFGDDLTRRLPDAGDVSRQLGMSVSTLRRLLLEEGTSFQKLKDECRRTAAIRYLAATDLSFSEIASLLGFDEASGFFRSFRRWTGTTPAAYRAGLQR
jgi:AraC-like DNA-binding protein